MVVTQKILGFKLPPPLWPSGHAIHVQLPSEGATATNNLLFTSLEVSCCYDGMGESYKRQQWQCRPLFSSRILLWRRVVYSIADNDNHDEESLNGGATGDRNEKTVVTAGSNNDKMTRDGDEE